MIVDMKSILPLEEALDPETSGRKAYNLALLTRAGFRVPRGFVITAGTPRETFGPALGPAFSALSVPLAAVRSSAAAEDGENSSFAGQFDSFLGVNAAGLEKAVLGCLASASNARAAAYGGGAPQRMAVIVQELVDADISGVAFSCDPVSGDRSTIVIEAVYGLCEPLVSGEITPDHYAADKAAFEVKEKSLAPQAEYLAANPAGGTRLKPVAEGLRARPKLDAALVRQIGAAAARAEELFKRPADIEWALKGGELYLLQARPVTGLGELI
jgi:phosphoenolpyruvate synthase/pyruvate phosphate dikinase